MRWLLSTPSGLYRRCRTAEEVAVTLDEWRAEDSVRIVSMKILRPRA